VGLVGGLIFSAVLSFFQQSGIIPQNLVIWFTIIGLVSSIITIYSFQTAGIIFTFGWILGAWLLKNFMSNTDFLVYFLGTGSNTGFQSICGYQENVV